MEPDAGNSRGSGGEPGAESLTLSALGYLPALFFLPMIAGRDEYARFHGRQSLVLFLALVAGWLCIWTVGLVFGRILGSIILLGFVFRALDWLVHNIVGGAVSLAYVGLLVAGMVQAALGRRWRMPFLGVYADRLAGQ